MHTLVCALGNRRSKERFTLEIPNYLFFVSLFFFLYNITNLLLFKQLNDHTNKEKIKVSPLTSFILISTIEQRPYFPLFL